MSDNKYNWVDIMKEHLLMEADDREDVRNHYEYYDTSGVLSKEEIDRVVAEIKETIKPKGETISKQAEELWASDFHGKEYIKSMKASDRAELLELMVTRKWGETK